MSKFVLTAQLQLQAPTNTRQVVNQLRQNLSGVNIPVQAQGAAKAKKQINQVTAATKQASKSAQNMGRTFGLAFKRFAAFTVASRAVSLFTNTLANAVEEAIDFQQEMVKIAQVTGKTIKQLKGLERTVWTLSTSLGVSSKELLSTTRILSQAGIKARDLDVALAALAKTTLAPTFEDINKTAEGAIAILAQFGQGVGALESQLGSINAVAGQFAVESGDLIGAIRRTGGVFKEAGGTLEEFLGLFTSIRATTRESAESISTGLRTILTRIQRPKTIEFLRQYGVELTDLEGRFVGPMEAVKRLNAAIGGLEQGDITFIRIAEEIAGFRQIGKVIPLLKEYELAERARQAAVEGGSSLAEDAATAQQALARQIMKVKQEFQELIQGIANTSTFQALVKTTLNLASALIKVADAIKPLLPLIAGLAAFKIAKGLGGFAAGVGGALRGASGKNQGGKILAFARGGMVPGQGNRDTVPAMLQPGEFVIRKSSVNKMGANTLAAMNENRFGAGGVIPLQVINNDNFGAFSILDEGDIHGTRGKKISSASKEHLHPKIARMMKGLSAGQLKGKQVGSGGPEGEFRATKDTNAPKLARAQGDHAAAAAAYKTGRYTRPQLSYAFGATTMNAVSGMTAKQVNRLSSQSNMGDRIANAQAAFNSGQYSVTLKGPFGIRQIGGPKEEIKEKFSAGISSAAETALKSGVEEIANSDLVKNLDFPPIDTDERKLYNFSNFLDGAKETVEGYLLEGITGALTNARVGGGGTRFDFPRFTKAAKGRLKKLYANDDGFIDNLRAADAKRQMSTARSGEGALVNKIAADRRVKIQLANRGGSIGGSGDTVPALLTPGEFVLNKTASKKIGYGNLNRMNKSGVAGFNKGGAVGVQRLNTGGMMGGMGSMVGFTAFAMVNSQLQELGTSADGTRNAFGRVTDVLTKYTVAIIGATMIWSKLTGKTVTFKGVMEALKDPMGSLKKVTNGAVSALDNFVAGTKGVHSKEQFEAEYETKGGDQVFKTGKEDKEGKPIFRKKDDKGEFITSGKGFREEHLTKKKGKSLGFRLRDDKGYTGKTGMSGKATLDTDPVNRALQELGGGLKGASEASRRIIKALKLEWLARNKYVQGMKKRIFGEAQIDPTTGAKSTKGGAIGGMFDRFTDSLTEFGRGTRTKKGGVKRGKGMSGRLGRMTQKIPGMKTIGGLLGRGATSAASTMGAASAAAGGGAAGAAAGLAAVAGPAIAVVGALKLLNDVTMALINTEERKRDAIEAGNMAEAGRLASSQNFDNWLTGGFQQGLVQAATAVGGWVDSFSEAPVQDSGLIEGTDQVGTFEYGITRLSEFMSGDFSGALRKAAQAAAAMSAAQKKVTQNSRDAADALADFKLGNISANELFDEQSKNFKNFGFAQRKAADALAASGDADSKSTGFTAGVRNTLAWTVGFIPGVNIDTAGEKNEKIDQNIKADKEAREKFEAEFDKMTPAFNSLSKSIHLSGGTLEDFKQQLEDNGTAAYLTEEQMKTLEKRFAQQAQAVDRQIAYIKALNFGLRDAAAAAGAMSTTMSNIVKSGEAGFNNFEASAAVLEASVTSAGKHIGDAQLDNAITDLESSMRTFGVSEGKIGQTTDTMRGLRDAQANTDKALKKAQDALMAGGDVSPQAIKDALGEGLLEGVEGPAREKLSAAIDNLEIDDEMRAMIKAGEIDKVLEKTLDPVTKAAAEEAVALVKKRGELENVLISATQKRIQQENEYIQAQKAAINTQLEAAKLFEDFGGAALTTQDKLGARIAQANLSLGAAGVGGLAGGGAGDIRRALSEVRAATVNQNDMANAARLGKAQGKDVRGAFEGAAGLDADKRDELKAANKAIVEFTQQRIALVKEELAIAEKKNAAEKEALDKLLGGDIEGFLEGQLAAAAGSALRMGDAGVASAFGAGALGAGFQTLEGQGLSDRAMQNAAGLALQNVGITDPRAAQVMAGTTAEEERLKEEGRGLAQVLGDAAQQGADLERMDVEAGMVVIKAAKMELERFEKNPEGFHRGGMVYASRGMFVPRGTDTVPAMLTPGEFVVNRSAVNAGNNLALLTAMNGGAGGAAGMSRGGMVYMKDGGILGKVANFMTTYGTPAGFSKLMGGPDIGQMVEDGINATSDSIKQNVLDPLKNALEDPTGLKGAFTQFDQSVQKLVDLQLNVKVDPTNVTVNFQGGSFLSTMKDEIRNELLAEVQRKIGDAKFNESGELQSNPGNMP